MQDHENGLGTGIAGGRVGGFRGIETRNAQLDQP
jgi:hypothetical protein